MKYLICLLSGILFPLLSFADGNSWNFQVPSMAEFFYSSDASSDTVVGLVSNFYSKENWLFGFGYNEAKTEYDGDLYKSQEVILQTGSNPLEDFSYIITLGHNQFESEIKADFVDFDLNYQTDHWAMVFSPVAKKYLLLTESQRFDFNVLSFSVGADYSFDRLSMGLLFSQTYFDKDLNEIYSTGLIDEISYVGESKVLALEEKSISGHLKFAVRRVGVLIWITDSLSKLTQDMSISYGSRVQMNVNRFLFHCEMGQNQTSSTQVTFGGIGLGMLF